MTTPPDSELSPGRWVAPPGTKPAWNWAPEGHGLHPRLSEVPTWVRLWYWTPFLDRYAHVWMWHHGGWEITPHPAGPSAGDREARRPVPPPLEGGASAVE
jgi:hypothetical protein